MEKLNGKRPTLLIIDDPIIERGIETHREFERLFAEHAAQSDWPPNFIQEGSFIAMDRGDADRTAAIISRIRKGEILLIDEVIYDPLGIQRWIHDHYKDEPVIKICEKESTSKRTHHQQPAWRRQGKRRGQGR